MKPVLYVVVNKSLGMSPGKVAAQVGHAVAGLMGQATVAQDGEWLDFGQRWLIVLEVGGGEQLYNLCGYLRERHVTHFAVIDEGVNEIPPFSLTAVGVGILDKDSEEAGYLSGLKRYSHSDKSWDEGYRAGESDNRLTPRGHLRAFMNSYYGKKKVLTRHGHRILHGED